MSLDFLKPYLHLGPAILLGGMVSLFACSRMLAGILPRDANSIGVRAVAYFCPIAAASLIAMLLGRSEIAIGIVFGTSVASMTTVIGFIATGGEIASGPQRLRRVWPFELAAALLVFVAGFKGTLNWRDAVALLTEGLLLLTLWNDRSNSDEQATTHDILQQAVGTQEIPYAIGSPHHRHAVARRSPAECAILTVELLLIAALLWLGGWAITQGTLRTSPLLKGMSTSGIAGSIVSLALTLPMMYGAWRFSAQGRGWSPASTQIAVCLLNLCVLLPMLILLPYAAAYVPALGHFAGGSLAWHERLPRLLIYPSPMWRIDNVLLIIVGVLLLPVALGKWALGREEGMALIAGYFFYLTFTVASSFAPGHG